MTDVDHHVDHRSPRGGRSLRKHRPTPTTRARARRCRRPCLPMGSFSHHPRRPLITYLETHVGDTPRRTRPQSQALRSRALPFQPRVRRRIGQPSVPWRARLRSVGTIDTRRPWPWSVGQLVVRSVCRSVSPPSVGRSVESAGRAGQLTHGALGFGRSVGRLVGRSVGRNVGQSAGRLGRSARCSLGLGRSVGRSVGQSARMLAPRPPI